MEKIIGSENKVNYGVFDGPIEFNYKDFQLLDFFGKEIRGLKKRFAFKRFNYIGIVTDQFLVGFAAVSLGYVYNVFAYLYHYKDGILYEFDTKGLDSGTALKFPANPDEYSVRFSKGASFLSVDKSHKEDKLNVDAFLGKKLRFRFNAKYGYATHSPLRVVNPSEPTRWTFTEKCSPITPSSIEISFQDRPLVFDPKKTTILYDWSGGYLRYETNWYWAALSAILPDRTSIGANFAALVNESFYSENAFWIDHERQRVPRLIFDFSQKDPYKPWRIRDEEGLVDLTFVPEGERKDKMNLILSKLYFRQFVGRFSGKFRFAKGREVSFRDVYGFTEFHRSLW
ncbi:DUF2804 domain-containing protein [Leptospira ellisii]|uniref:DUF2804 domain-containing protein n=2 Tax=Leptospira ellisii TaxID=2023197 RepID=A0A2N0BD67_9LEPT|nr:DUF2804 domain-containing protein [Leptospira ellisii]MDV6236054.1 DUF2804 domain-containing protein [Leptospira ellisii]PJZ94502.1 hypothetical protein CH379_02290 [Leptospira ellisii]